MTPRDAAEAPLIPSPLMAGLTLLSRRRTLGLGLLALALAVVFAAAIPGFATRPNLFAMLAAASVTGVAAVGLVLVVMSGGVDLSIGAVAGLAPLLGSLWVGHPAAPVGLALCLATGALIGLGSGLLVGGGLAAFAVTLGVEAAVRGVAGSLAATPGRGASALTLIPSLDATIVGLPVSIALLAVIAGLATAFLKGLRGGRILRAIGSDRAAARAAGLPVFGYGVLPYVLSGVLATLAGLLSATAAPSSLAITELGGTLTLDALAAVVIGGASLRGGRGSVPATLLGVVLVVMVRAGLWLLDVPSLAQGCAIGLLLLAGLAVDRFTDPRRTAPWDPHP